MGVTFNTLKKEATIFSELAKEPEWWEQFKKEDSLYIEVRKDNEVNVYFEGGSIARIHYCSRHKKLQVFIHHKYLGIEAAKPMYVECSDFIGDQLDDILNRIKLNYSQKNAKEGAYPKEKWSEKFIQGNLILRSREIHLDSEFTYKDGERDIRMDLVRVANGVITFVELKRINDNRLLKKTDEQPEVIGQMKEYAAFIKKYKADLLNYYQRLFAIKKSLGLPVPDSYPTSVNPIPELLIFNLWEKGHPARDNHKSRMEFILTRENITYRIIDGF